MVHLDKDQTKDESNSILNKEEGRVVRNIETSNVQNANSELEKFSLFVLKMISDENIHPTPNNFQIYFEKLLENKPLAFRKRINAYLELDDGDGDDYRAKMEREIKEGFVQVKSIVKIVSTVYKNLGVMKQIVKKRLSELGMSSSQLSVDNILSALNDDLEKLSNLTQKQMEALKYHYENTIQILKDVENKAIFDTKYGIYNKKFLLASMSKELAAVKQYNHSSTLVLVKIKDEVLDKIVNSKEKEVLRRNIAKLLLRTSRRSDVVAHYSEGIFAVLMKHTDLNNAKKACERIGELIYGTSFFIGEEEIEIDIELGIMPVYTNCTIEESISGALEVLPNTGKDLEPYLMGEFYGEVK